MPQYEDVYEPPMLDSTGQDMLTQLTAMVTKLQGIIDGLSPTAAGVSVSNTGMHIVTEDDVQGAISELDSAVDSVNSSLTQKIVIESKELTFVSSVATLAKKDGYVLLQVYGIRPNNETGAGYHIDGWIASSDGNNYYIHNSVSNLNAGLSCRLIWVKS